MSRLMKISLVLILAAAALFFYLKPGSKRSLDFSKTPKPVVIDDDGIEYTVSTGTNNLEEFLEEEKLTLEEEDTLWPAQDSSLFPGMRIEIRRGRKIKIKADGKTIEAWSNQRDVSGALRENGIALGRLDKVDPEKFFPLENDATLIVTRINVEEKVIPEDTDFKTVTKTDSKMGWREKNVEQEGQKGTVEVDYKITYKNGKEISRVVLSKNVTKDPVPEIVVQGTYVKLGKSSTGQGTWYTYQGGLFAASPWLPMGSYAKVTNRDNGKSVIVEINDRGPTGKGRIIDLDKVAFGKIASLGAGVINVKVEEVLN